MGGGLVEPLTNQAPSPFSGLNSETKVSENLWAQVIIAASTFFAGILGYLLAGVNDARRDRRSVERETVARREEARTAALRSRHEFQLETLLALQDAVQRMARLTGRAIHFDHMHARKSLYTQLPDEYDQEMTANSTDVSRLRNRILDSGLREAIATFQSASNQATESPGRYEGLQGPALEAEAMRVLREFGAHVDNVMNQIGVALRSELVWEPGRA